MFEIMYILFFGILAFILVRGIKQWHDNNNSPRLSVEATVVAKRTRVKHDHHDDMVTHSTTYYATFQVASGDRMELVIPSNQIGYLVEGDRGMLTFQGTRFLNFSRENINGS